MRVLKKICRRGSLIGILGGLLALTSSGCTYLAFHPSRELYFPPEKMGFKAQEIEFDSGDGTKLVGWYFRAQGGAKPKSLIVQMHGNAENMSSHYISLAWLVREGHDLFTFDYRGYGKSQGEIDDRGLIEDSQAALEKALAMAQVRGLSSIVVFGQSLGGLAAMASVGKLSEADRSKVSLLVLDSTFFSYKRIALQKLSGNPFTFLFGPIGWLVMSDSYSAVDALPLLTMPKIIIHDKEDGAVPYRNAELMMERLPDPKELWTLDKGRHVGAFALDTPENRKRFLETLDKIHPPRPPAFASKGSVPFQKGSDPF